MEMLQIPCPDSCFDLCFNEGNPQQILSAGGDSTLKLWNFAPLNQPQPPQAQPLRVFRGHTAEVQSVEWNHLNKVSVVSGSMDKTAKIWDSTGGQLKGSLPHDGVVN
mmetsp:Transcript_16065/g.27108  ORF Transcript_16065/g.27108 Transcript_16065/m.27108 type:complete len:107 (+) Transcript_16065:170-490(+)